MYHVKRFPDGTTLGRIEYLLNDDNSLMEFESKEDAETFLKENGVDPNSVCIESDEE